MHTGTYRGLQGLRLLTGLVVVAVHSARWFNRDAGSGRVAPQAEFLGDICVAAFFLISGFVVVLVVDSGRESDWRTFALRRAIRILPLAWAMTAVKVAAAVIAPGAMFDGGLSATRIVSSLLLIPSRDPEGQVRMLWGVEWTLVFEVAFYALVTVALATRIDPVRATTFVLLGVATLSLWQSDDGSVLWYYADPVVLYIVAGAWLARASRGHGSKRTIAGLLGLAVGFVLLHGIQGDATAFAAATQFVALVGGFAGLVVAEPVIGRHVPDWVVRGGEISFALYLTHPLVAQALPRIIGWTGLDGVPWFPVVVASTAVSIPLAWAVHHWLDVPTGRFLRRTLTPRPPTMRAAAGGGMVGPAPQEHR